MNTRTQRIPGARHWLASIAQEPGTVLHMVRHPFAHDRWLLLDARGNHRATDEDKGVLLKWALANGYNVRDA